MYEPQNKNEISREFHNYNLFYDGLPTLSCVKCLRIMSCSLYMHQRTKYTSKAMQLQYILWNDTKSTTKTIPILTIVVFKKKKDVHGFVSTNLHCTVELDNYLSISGSPPPPPCPCC